MKDTSIEASWRDTARRGRTAAGRMLDEASGVVPAFGDAARAAADALRVAGRKASAVMADLTDEARGTDMIRRGVETRGQMVNRVQAQPLASVLIAAGIGLIAGMFLSRR